ncbi:MAG: substrate-binding domain-containing protein [Opitutaceae bacterium]
MPAPAAVTKVALLFEANNAYARGLLVGIGDYILSHGPWSVHYAELGPADAPPPWLRAWDGHGMIVRGENRRLARAVAELSTPTIDLTPSRLLPRAPWVKSDDAAIAHLAAQHFLERGFRHFAFCGDARFSWSQRRGERFAQLAREAGHTCHHFAPPPAPRPRSSALHPLDADATVDAIGTWLTSLPKPVAVFACYDNRGQQVLEACHRTGLAVPEQVAVLGVDNDEVLCALSPPPLSSITLNPRRAGWEAAALLSRLMRGELLPPAAHLIPPVAIATRQSTDILAVHDPKIASALRYIREHACAGIGVGEVLRHCPMARRALENRFARLLGRTPGEEILRVQLNRVKELLIGTKLPIWEIAGRTGFGPEYLSVVFQRQFKTTPSRFRRDHGVTP